MKLARRHVEARAAQRGYTLESIEPCFLSQYEDGEWEVDVFHPAYPHDRNGRPAIVVPRPGGPGTELKKLLAKIGIHATEACSCSARARIMDDREASEPGWCAANLDEIVGWLREEATKRQLPFIEAGARLLVKRAIANAKKKRH